MEKEILTLSNIKKDLETVAYLNISNKQESHLSYIIPLSTIAILIGFLLRNVWIGLLIFSPAVYCIVLYIKSNKEYKTKQKALHDVLERGDISISVETLSHIAREQIYEPHVSSRGHRHTTKEVTLFHFTSGAEWRILTHRHYQWSQNYCLSTIGLENTSVEGNEFFHVSIQGHYDIAYIYPCKFFKLDPSLKLKQ